MMQNIPFVLADGDSSHFPIIIVIVAVIWGIRPFSVFAKKAGEQLKSSTSASKDVLSMSMPTQRTIRPPALSPRRQPGVFQTPIQQRTAAALSQMAPRLVPPAQGLAQMTAPRPQPAPAPAPAAPPAPPTSVSEFAIPPVKSHERPKRGANAESLRKWLTPATLQKQFIITELFQPPVSMREYQDHA